MTYSQIYFITTIAFSVTMLYIDLTYFNIFLDKKRYNNIITRILLYTCYVSIKLFQFHTIIPYSINLMLSLVTIIMITLLYSYELKKLIVVLVIKNALGLGINTILTYSYPNFINANLESNVVLLLVQILFIKIFQRVLQIQNIKTGVLNLLFIMIIPPISIYIIHIANINNNYASMPIVILALLLQNILFYIFYDKLIAYNKIELDNNMLKDNIKYYDATYENLKIKSTQIDILRHDCKYNLEYIYTKLDDCSYENISNIKDELNDILGKISQDDWVNYTHNNSLDILINEKINNNPKINFDIQSSNLSCILLKERELFVILSNILDNAIQNYDECSSLLKRLIVVIYEENGSLFIKVSNPFNHNIKFNERFPITNKYDKNSHGFGLKSVDLLVNEQSGQFKILTKDNIFTVKIVILLN